MAAKKDKNGPDEEVAQKLRNEHGEIFTVSVPDVEDSDGKTPYDTIAIRRPTEGEVERLMAEILDDAKKSKAIQKLTRACRVWPDTATFDAMIERRPGLLLTFGKSAQKLAGIVDEGELKKV